MTSAAVVVVFGRRRVPRPLRGLPRRVIDHAADSPESRAVLDDALADATRVVVVGSVADVAAVLTRLLRRDRLDVEVAAVHRRWGARRALSRTARPAPLIRDDTGTAIVGAAHWLPEAPVSRRDGAMVRGEGIVDDTVLFDGDCPGVRIEPIDTAPGLRAAVAGPVLRRRRWVVGRAAQLGTTGARVVRDGVSAPRPVRRSTFYRHTTDWLRVGR